MLQFIASNQTNPYLNIAVENHLVANNPADCIVLYMWKNRRTVVIGQNQNPYTECNVDLLEADGGFLMRRRTGGGAVYHDDGNINFSFIVPHALYDQQRQFSVMAAALATFGLDTQLSGRNDVQVCVDGEFRKFSGNAFSRGRTNNLHHGTILINGNIADMQRYLRPKPNKLQKHGVNSVRSRVANLAELNAAITTQAISDAMMLAFEHEYGEKATIIDFDNLIKDSNIQALYSDFASPEWKYGRWRQFSAQRSAWFDWGGVEMDVKIDSASDKIIDVEIATDALDLDAIAEAKRLLVGASATTEPAAVPDNKIIADIVKLIYT